MLGVEPLRRKRLPRGAEKITDTIHWGFLATGWMAERFAEGMSVVPDADIAASHGELKPRLRGCPRRGLHRAPLPGPGRASGTLSPASRNGRAPIAAPRRERAAHLPPMRHSGRRRGGRSGFRSGPAGVRLGRAADRGDECAPHHPSVHPTRPARRHRSGSALRRGPGAGGAHRGFGARSHRHRSPRRPAPAPGPERSGHRGAYGALVFCFALKTPWSDGTGHLLLSPLELLEKLAALVPPPRFHLLRYHGVLAPRARDRGRIVPAEPAEASTAADRESSAASCGHRLGWAALLTRVFPPTSANARPENHRRPDRSRLDRDLSRGGRAAVGAPAEGPASAAA